MLQALPLYGEMQSHPCAPRKRSVAGDGVPRDRICDSFFQTCLKESDGSDTEDFCSDHSEDCLSEASWEPVDKKETEVCVL